MSEKTIQEKVRDAILEEDVSRIEINGTTYNVAMPSAATLIEISALYSTLPRINTESGNIIREVMVNAEHARTIARIIAVSILGARREKKSRWGRDEYTEKLDSLTDEVLHNVSFSVQKELIQEVLIRQEITDFFAIIISLAETEVTAPTREMIKEN